MTDTRNMTLRNLVDYKEMAELTQPEKLGRHIIEQCLDSHEVMDSYTMSVDILARLNNAGLMIARVVPEGEK